MQHSTNGIGFESLAVYVESVGEDGYAVCKSEFGKFYKINSHIRRGGGPQPRNGERWVIDRTLGFWTFAALLNPNPPTVTGSRSDGTALESLLSVMVELGFIVDETTD